MRFRFHPLIISVVGTLSFLTTIEASAEIKTCEKLFSVSPERLNEAGDLEAKKLVDLVDSFSEATLSQRDELDSAPVFELLEEIDLQTKTMIEAYGYWYAPEPVKFLGISYNVYRLRGTIDGSYDARQLYALQRGRSYKDNSLRLVFDPLLTLRNSGFVGTYADGTATIGVRSAVDRLAKKGYVLRHEIQHHLEELKISRNHYSLRRLSLSDGVNPDVAYGRFAGVDEMESFLRELRLGVTSEEETLAFGYVHRIGETTLQAIKIVTQQMERPLGFSPARFLLGSRSYKYEAGRLTFDRLPAEFPYRKFEIDISGELSKDPDKGEIERRAKSVMLWSVERIAAIQKEITERAARPRAK